jgi:NAD(P)-dependent dehydrogenase (short-subunit alcohol dehydrogenase family)
MTHSPQSGLLAGRRALVTGAAGGIGAAVVRELQLAGARVVGVDASASYDGFVGDVSDPGDMAAAVAAAGELDICVANAGISLMEPLLDGDPGRWRAVLEVNLIGVLVTFQAAARAMAAHGRGGRLLAVSSVAGLRGESGTAAYAASKAGVIGLVKALAVELADHGITVNGVAPGQIDTAMHRRDLDVLGRRIGRPSADLLREHLERRVPARRRGLPEEVAAVLTFLASDAAAYVNGEIVRIDGGETAG